MCRIKLDRLGGDTIIKGVDFLFFVRKFSGGTMNMKNRLIVEIAKPVVSPKAEDFLFKESEELPHLRQVEKDPNAKLEMTVAKNTDTTFTVIEQRVIKLASSGVAAVTIASMLNIDKSYVSQILGKEHISEAVQVSSLAKNATYEQLDEKWDNLEEKLLDKVSDRISFMDNKQLGVLLVAANNAKRRRGLENNIPSQNNIQITNITLPTRIIARYTTNSNNEITEVDGKVLDTMPSRNLLDRYESDNNERIDRQIEDSFTNPGEVVSTINQNLLDRNMFSGSGNIEDNIDTINLINLRADDL